MQKERARSLLSGIPLGRVLIALGVVLVAINIAAAIWDARTARERVERRAQRDFSNMTRLLAEQTAASLEAVDLVLRDAARARSAQDMAAQAPRLRAELSHVPHVAGLLVFDAKGRLLARTDADGFEPSAYALQREAGGSGIFISEPYPEGADGRWRVLLSRRLGGAGGGVLAAAIELTASTGSIACSTWARALSSRCLRWRGRWWRACPIRSAPADAGSRRPRCTTPFAAMAPGRAGRRARS